MKRLILATRYSLDGLRHAWRREAAFRQEALLAVVVLLLAMWWGRTGLESALLGAVWLSVMVVELINTALGAVVDRIGPERHTLAGVAKDAGSAAVFVWSSILAGG